MAEAARRAREGAGGAAAEPTDGGRGGGQDAGVADVVEPPEGVGQRHDEVQKPPGEPSQRLGDSAQRPGGPRGWVGHVLDRLDSPRGRRGLVLASAATTCAVVLVGAAAAGLALVPGGPSTDASAPPPAGTHGTVGSHGPASASGSSTPSSTMPPTSAAPPTSAPKTAPGGAPQIAALGPPSGAPGQTVVVTGSGFFSSDGEVTAYFNGAPAPTGCATQTSCTVTVPDLGAARSTVTVTLSTAAGTSNAVQFTYL